MTITKSFYRLTSVMTLGLAVLVIVGCGGPPRAKVHGTVSIDGTPLKDGTIEFYPIDGKGQSAAGAIINGKYDAVASVGEMKVSINGTEVIGKRKAYETPDSPMIEDVRNPVPARYNQKSELKTKLESGDNTKDFELKSESKRK